MIISINKYVILIFAVMGLTNIILATLIFYMMIPLISPRIIVDRADIIAENIQKLTNADVTFVFAVDLTANSRKVNAFRNLNKEDLPLIESYINFVEMMRFTTAVNPNIVRSLISNESICYPIIVTGITKFSPIKELLKNYPNAVACAVPIYHKHGILKSYVLTVWRFGFTNPEIEKPLVISTIKRAIEISIN